jgi:hypothetical protein
MFGCAAIAALQRIFARLAPGSFSAARDQSFQQLLYFYTSQDSQVS